MADKKGKKYVSDNAQLMAEWNWEINADFVPSQLTLGSHKKVWWKCTKGHEWQATIKDRNYGYGCPYCSGRYAIKGENDLQTVNPQIAKEWNYEKNGNLRPENFTANSHTKVWWKCSKEHEWQANIYNRNNGSGCPVCNSERNTSLPEYALLYYLKKYGLEVIHLYKEKGYELDIYIPSKKIAIEYDGYLWHKNSTKKDLEKNFKCEKDGIKLYRIREGLLPLNHSSIDYVVQKDQKDLSHIIEEVLSDIIGTSIDIDVKRDAIYIENLREYTEKETSLLFSNLEIAKEWNYEKNGNLKPEYFATNSNKKVWWKCNKGHEWQATISHRNNNRGCPYCSNKKVLKGYNDMQTINPTLANDWHFGKNDGLTPMDVTPNSNKKVWWKCRNGHEWQATIDSRNQGNGCPYCSGRKVLKGYNDLKTVNPNLVNEWNFEKNIYLKPEKVTANSGQKTWWKCSKGHEWEAIVQNRNKGDGCPYCSGKKILIGYNDLQSINSNLADEWNYEKNNGLTPMDVTPGSSKKVWWKCNKGHEWQATINSRNSGSGCPYCSGLYVIKGENDLQTVSPTLAKEWNYEKNNGLTPMDVTPGSSKKVWWKCNKGHEWQATIKDRNSGCECPYCVGKKVAKGYNDLQTVNPTLASEWNYEKNDILSPVDVMPNSHKKMWWKCNRGHEWLATIASRNRGSGCPFCRKDKK